MFYEAFYTIQGNVESSFRKQQLSEIPEQVSMGRAANQSPALATVCKKAVAGKAAAQWGQSALQGLWTEISALNTTIKHPGVKLIRSLLQPTASPACQQLPERHQWPTGKVQEKFLILQALLQQFLILQALLCLSHLRENIAKEHQAWALCFMTLLFRKPFYLLNRGEIYFYVTGCSQPPLTWSHPRAFLERWEQTAGKWKWSLEGQSLFWEGILVR